MSDEVEQIYELTAQILVLGHSVENAVLRARRVVVINDLLEDPTVSDWSHLDKPLWSGHDTEASKQNTIKQLTREIQKRERRR